MEIIVSYPVFYSNFTFSGYLVVKAVETPQAYHKYNCGENDAWEALFCEKAEHKIPHVCYCCVLKIGKIGNNNNRKKGKNRCFSFW